MYVVIECRESLSRRDTLAGDLTTLVLFVSNRKGSWTTLRPTHQFIIGGLLPPSQTHHHQQELFYYYF